MANKVLRQNAIRPILATAPTGLAGVIYYDSGVSKLQFHNGTAFVELADFGQLGSTTSGASGATKLGGDNKTYSNISGLSTFTIQDFLDRINVAIGAAASTSVSDAAFEIFNAAAPTKLFKFDASGITAGQTRTLKMANANVDLAALDNTNIAAAAAIALNKLAATTATRVLVSDANGFVSASSTTPTTLGYLDVSSSLTTLLSGKVSTAGDTMSGTLAMGSNKITSSYVPLNGDDLVNKTALDNAITGISWIAPVSVFNLRGNLTIAGIDGLSPVQGDQYLATDAGTPTAGTSDALAAGDIAEFNGTSWKKIIANSGGFAPAGTRVILGGTGATIATPYTDATDNDKLAIFSGTSNTAAIQAGVVANSVSLNVSDPGHISFFDNASFVYEGSAPTGAWIQFNGAGQISAGTGILKSGNTLSVKLGAGIAGVPTSEVGIDLWATAPGLILTTDGTTPSTATGAQLRAMGIADANIAAAAAIALNKLAATTATRVLVSDANGFVSASSTTPTTLGYLDVSSSLTTLLSGKEPTITTLSVAKGGTNSGTALNNGRIMSTVGGAIVEAAAITPAFALISDANGIPTHSSVSSTVLGYLDIGSSLTTLLSGKLSDVVGDTSPQLGGDLDPNGKAIINTVRFGATAANSVEEDYLHAQSLTASTTAVLATLTFDSKVYKSLMIEYTCRRGNDRRTGRIMISANNVATAASSVVDIFHDELDTTDLALTWSVAMNGDNVEVSYTTSTGTYVANMHVKRFKA
jgi:hypothetical protein